MLHNNNLYILLIFYILVFGGIQYGKQYKI